MGKIFRFLNSDENIIAIRNRDISEANAAFAEFMQMTEDGFNERSSANPKLYKGISPSQLEEVTEQLLKEIAPSTPFRPEEIKLVSGHSFPDIMTEKYFGVEVKSTQSNKWTSTGSSIVENTRDSNVENIYMLFGKLGGTPPEFRCRPYQDCLSNVHVTHSPRYIIDMEIRDKQEKTIFEKINVPYSQFHKHEDKIEIIRDYYIQKSLMEGKHEMPWWVGKKTIESDENDITPSISLMSNKSVMEKRDLKAQMAILFPQVLKGDYDSAALWLCTHRYLLDLHLRDAFSAGGQWKYLNGSLLRYPLPSVIGNLQLLMPFIKACLKTNKDLEYLEFNPSLYGKTNKLDLWINQVCKLFENDKEFASIEQTIDLRALLLYPQKYILQRK